MWLTFSSAIALILGLNSLIIIYIYNEESCKAKFDFDILDDKPVSKIDGEAFVNAIITNPLAITVMVLSNYNSNFYWLYRAVALLYIIMIITQLFFIRNYFIAKK